LCLVPEIVHKFFVWKRPHVDAFVEYLLENFEVGVWSSAMKHNVDKLIDFVFGTRRKEVLGHV
jgi:TFIIF-interacting CTD phosphatase-like protein